MTTKDRLETFRRLEVIDREEADAFARAEAHDALFASILEFRRRLVDALEEALRRS